MLFVAPSFWKRPEFVAAVVDPAADPGSLSRRKILALVLGIHEQVGMSAESHLHEPATQLRHNREAHPVIRNLLGLPLFEGRGLHPARRLGGGQRPSRTERCKAAGARHKECNSQTESSGDVPVRQLSWQWMMPPGHQSSGVAKGGRFFPLADTRVDVRCAARLPVLAGPVAATDWPAYARPAL